MVHIVEQGFRVGMLVMMSASAAAAQESGRAHASPVPGTAAVAVADGGTIELDGRLDESIWVTVTAATDFIQMEPTEGQPALQRTEVRVVYDDAALYIGARMYDTEGAAGVRSLLSRRDQIEGGDWIEIVFDTFHDHVGRTSFQINPSGVKTDAGQAAAFADPAWDGVWDVATSIDAQGWVAELRIPFSQLRYPTAPVQTWGMQVWRYVERIAETSMWSFWGQNDAGGPSRFGHVADIRVPDRRIAVELMPYVVAKAEHLQPAQADNPFHDPTDYGWRAGGDLKAVLSSALTLDLTVNPDFGQVEVDPAVVNLSQFETFFPERRPFFVAGSGLFGFGSFSCFTCSNVSSMSLFYSRRVGRSPQGGVSDPAAFVDAPNSTTILGAAKVTGRTAGGLQIGVLDAVTSRATARALSPDGVAFEEEVEPLSNYFVGRVSHTLRDGNLTIGGIGTSVLRRFDSDALRNTLPSSAIALGTDWSLHWNDRTYNFMGNLAYTQVDGAASAIERLQLAPQRYFARPDREHSDNRLLWSDAFDAGRETLRGLGGYGRLAKVAGDLLWETQVNWRSPGFEANDLAFLTRADYVYMLGNVFRRWTTPNGVFRRADVIVGAQQQYNFDGDLTDRQVHAFTGMQTANYMWLSLYGQYRPEVYDDRLTRGGAVVRRAALWGVFPSFETDGRKAFVFAVNPGYSRTAEGASSYNIGTYVRYRPASNITLSLGPSYSRSESTAQFVRSFEDPSADAFHGRRAVFADIVQHTLGMDTRVQATFTPDLSLELFVQPFTSSGEYSLFKEFVAPRGLEKRPFDDVQLTARLDADGHVSGYTLDPDRDGTTENFRFENPDFNFRSLRGNAVLRWEYLPGSTVFLVWQQQRSGSVPTGRFDFSSDTRAIFDGQPDNIFLVKMTYWLGR
ncbi:MAG: DUF5916 domain-containing protein [Longimicrobiales bacterium]